MYMKIQNQEILGKHLAETESYVKKKNKINKFH